MAWLLWARFLVLALLAGPMTLVVWMMIGDAKHAKEFAASVQHSKRPIVDTGAPGFTAAPVYAVADDITHAEARRRGPVVANAFVAQFAVENGEFQRVD